MTDIELVRHHLKQEFIFRPVDEINSFIESFYEAMNQGKRKGQLNRLVMESFQITHNNYTKMIGGLVNALETAYYERKADELFLSQTN